MYYFWTIALVIFVIWFLSREPYFYDYYVSCKKWVKEFIAGRWEWFRSLPALKQTYLFIAGIVAFALFVLFFRLYLELFLFEWNDPKIKDNSIRDLAIAFFGTISGIGALFGVYLAILRSEENTRQNKIANDQSKTADKQAITAEQGLITDRINKATEGLGKFNDKGDPIIEVRLGALYALERIAQDSIRDHIQIMEILCAYIRHASLKNKADKTKSPTEDIQAALTIIGRRDKWPKGKKRIEKEYKERYHINLNNCYLYGAKFSRGNLVNATLIEANLSYAWFNDTDLSDAALGDAILVNAWFEDTILKNTELSDATTTGVHARDGDFSNCLTFTQPQINEMFFGAAVKLADGLNHPQEGTDYYETYDELEDFFAAYEKWRAIKKTSPEAHPKQLITNN